MSEGKGFADLVVCEDQLGLEKYCKGLGEFILGCDTPMTISIQGKWGSGKSSIFNITREKFLQDAIDQGRVLYIPFDTWMYCRSSASENLTLLLMNQLYNQIMEATERADAAGEKHRLLEKAAGVLKEGTLILSDNIAGGRFTDKLEEVLNVLSNSRDQLNEAAALLTIKQEMSSKIKEYCEGEAERRIVIFVDDLDRLDPVIAVELLEGIKTFLDCRYCVFVLAIDNSVVYDGVYKKYNLTRGVEEHDQKAYSFFDKIIQVPFTMPYGVYAIDNYIKPFLENESRAITYRLLIQRYIPDNNPRAIKRVFSLFSLNKLILDGCIRTDEDKLCLFLLTLLQVVSNDYYLELISNIDKLEEFLSEDRRATQNFNHCLNVIIEATREQPDHNGTTDDDDDVQRAQLLTVIKSIFSNTTPVSQDAIRQRLEDAGVIASDVNESIKLYSWGNKKLCRISDQGNGTNNITVYGADFEEKVYDFAGQHQNILNRYRKEASHVTLTGVDRNDTELMNALFNLIIGIIEQLSSQN